MGTGHHAALAAKVGPGKIGGGRRRRCRRPVRRHRRPAPRRRADHPPGPPSRPDRAGPRVRRHRHRERARRGGGRARARADRRPGRALRPRMRRPRRVDRDGGRHRPRRAAPSAGSACRRSRRSRRRVPTFFKNVTIAGGPAPVRAYIEELLPDVLDGRIQPGRVFDRVTGPRRGTRWLPRDERPRGHQGHDRVLAWTVKHEQYADDRPGGWGDRQHREPRRRGGDRAGHAVRALVRNASKGRRLPSAAELIVGDVTRPETLFRAVDGIDAIVFTHGSDGGARREPRMWTTAGSAMSSGLGSRPVRIALMTSIGVTDRTGNYNRSTQACDWKRRSERLVRVSGKPYTIVRPGWFDYNAPNEQRLICFRGIGATRATPAMARWPGARSQRSSSKPYREPAEQRRSSWSPPRVQRPRVGAAVRSLDADPSGSLDAVHDSANMPLEEEPQGVRVDLARVESRPRR